MHYTLQFHSFFSPASPGLEKDKFPFLARLRRPEKCWISSPRWSRGRPWTFGSALTENVVFIFIPQVEITLQDVNDNPPVFPNDILDVTIEENVGDGFKIMQLTATDADEVNGSHSFCFVWQGLCTFSLPVFHSAAFVISSTGSNQN